MATLTKIDPAASDLPLILSETIQRCKDETVAVRRRKTLVEGELRVERRKHAEVRFALDYMRALVSPEREAEANLVMVNLEKSLLNAEQVAPGGGSD